MAWMAGPAAQAWEAPALDPAMLKAVGLTFVELAIVTAIALFFSTFSSPMLSAAFTIRPVRGRPVQRRPQQHQRRRRFAGRERAGARALLDAAEPVAVRCPRPGRARPAGHGGLPGADHRLRAALHRRACWSPRCWSSRDGTSSSGARVHRPDRRRLRSGRASWSPAPPVCSGVRERDRPPSASAEATLVRHVRQRAEAFDDRLHRARRRSLLDSRPPVLRRDQAAPRSAAAPRDRSGVPGAELSRLLDAAGDSSPRTASATPTNCCTRCST